jgi:hypothetical protein
MTLRRTFLAESKVTLSVVAFRTGFLSMAGLARGLQVGDGVVISPYAVVNICSGDQTTAVAEATAIPSGL